MFFRVQIGRSPMAFASTLGFRTFEAVQNELKHAIFSWVSPF